MTMSHSVAVAAAAAGAAMPPGLPCRSCAAALMAFLSHAGFRMSAVYGRQFHKLLQNMDAHYVPALEAKAETDISKLNLRFLGASVGALTQYTGPDGASPDQGDKGLLRCSTRGCNVIRRKCV